MLNKWRKYSYTAQKQHRYGIIKVLCWILVLCVAHIIVSNTLFYTIVIQTKAMEPSVYIQERFIVRPLILSRYVSKLWNRDVTEPLDRGSLVVVERKEGDEKHSLPSEVFNQMLRYFTAQKLQDSSMVGPYMKRIVAFPGDEVSIKDYVVSVKPATESYALTEFELASKPYNVILPEVSELWNEGLPFSGHMEPLKLGADEYFVISDDRSNTNDSRTWGPVSSRSLTAKPLLRYWPPVRFGIIGSP